MDLMTLSESKDTDSYTYKSKAVSLKRDISEIMKMKSKSISENMIKIRIFIVHSSI